MRNLAADHQRPIPGPADATGRFLDLLLSFSVLRQNGQHLVGQIRDSIHEMRSLRSQLRNHLPISSSDSRDGDQPANELRDRFGLTRREIQVAGLLAQGWSNSDIARELKISAHTARHHTQRVLSKLQVHSRAAAGAKLRP